MDLRGELKCLKRKLKETLHIMQVKKLKKIFGNELKVVATGFEVNQTVATKKLKTL